MTSDFVQKNNVSITLIHYEKVYDVMISTIITFYYYYFFLFKVKHFVYL